MTAPAYTDYETYYESLAREVQEEALTLEKESNAKWQETELATNVDAFDAGYQAAARDLEAVLIALDEAVVNKVTTSRIRVKLSRPLTWAEKESLETDETDEHLRRINETVGNYQDALTLSVERDGNDEFTYVWAEAGYGSRILFELVSAALEHDFVNVFPRAVKTVREYNG